jgi:hypothetical protein
VLADAQIEALKRSLSTEQPYYLNPPNLARSQRFRGRLGSALQADVSGAGAGDMEQVPGSVFLDLFEIASSATASIRSATGSRHHRKS